MFHGVLAVRFVIATIGGLFSSDNDQFWINQVSHNF
jgi:hypothetical protein